MEDERRFSWHELVLDDESWPAPRKLGPRVIPDPWPEYEEPIPGGDACLLGWMLWALVVATGLCVGAGGAWLVLRRLR